MIIHLLDAHAGRHAADAAALLAVPSLFRRLVPRRRKVAPAVLCPAGAATLTLAQQLAHADAMHETAKRYLPDPPARGEHPYPLPRRKPMVNRPPWATAELPVYGERPVAEVLAAEAEASRRAAWYQHVPATYRGAWQ